jgi:hypothetical protein
VEKKREEGVVHTSFFETLTVMGLKYFAESNVDAAVIEVGLGGKMDATNISKLNKSKTNYSESSAVLDSITLLFLATRLKRSF